MSMSEFGADEGAPDAPPGLVPKLITLSGLAIVCAWVIFLIL